MQIIQIIHLRFRRLLWRLLDHIDRPRTGFRVPVPACQQPLDTALTSISCFAVSVVLLFGTPWIFVFALPTTLFCHIAESRSLQSVLANNSQTQGVAPRELERTTRLPSPCASVTLGGLGHKCIQVPEIVPRNLEIQFPRGLDQVPQRYLQSAGASASDQNFKNTAKGALNASCTTPSPQPCHRHRRRMQRSLHPFPFHST